MSDDRVLISLIRELRTFIRIAAMLMLLRLDQKACEYALKLR